MTPPHYSNTTNASRRPVTAAASLVSTSSSSSLSSCSTRPLGTGTAKTATARGRSSRTRQDRVLVVLVSLGMMSLLHDQFRLIMVGLPLRLRPPSSTMDPNLPPASSRSLLWSITTTLATTSAVATTVHEADGGVADPTTTTTRTRPVVVPVAFSHDDDDKQARSTIRTVYHLGYGKPYGRTNNQLVTLMHALDIALDDLQRPPPPTTVSRRSTTSSPFTDENGRAVIAVSNWAYRLLQGFFYQPGADELEFQRQLERSLVLPSSLSSDDDSTFPVQLVYEGRLPALGLVANSTGQDPAGLIHHVYLDTKRTYFYLEQHRHHYSSAILAARRTYVLGRWFHQLATGDGNERRRSRAERDEEISGGGLTLAAQNFVVATRVQHAMKNTTTTVPTRTWTPTTVSPYIVIHARWLEGECERRVGALLPAREECEMTPTYIKAILASAAMANTTTTTPRRQSVAPERLPLVVITDGQNPAVVTTLRQDPELGARIRVPDDTFSDDPMGMSTAPPPQPYSDMLVAIQSEVFIGTRASSFATMIGMIRVALGYAPATNYIYTEQHSSPAPPPQTQVSGVSSSSSSSSPVMMIDVCEECLFLCDNTQSHLCGHEVIYS